MHIYVASSWRNTYYPEVVRILRTTGHDVYDFRNPPSGDPGFHWTDVDEHCADWTPAQYQSNLTHPLAERQFKNDIEANDFVVIARFVGESTPPQGVNMPPRGVNTPSWGVKTPPSEKEKTLLELIKEHPGERTPFFAEMTGRSEKSIEYEIAHLKSEPAKIEFRGAPKTGGYFIKEGVS